jgi:hypothetical protein
MKLLQSVCPEIYELSKARNAKILYEEESPSFGDLVMEIAFEKFVIKITRDRGIISADLKKVGSSEWIDASYVLAYLKKSDATGENSTLAAELSSAYEKIDSLMSSDLQVANLLKFRDNKFRHFMHKRFPDWFA